MDKQQIIEELRNIHEEWMGQVCGMLNGQGKTKRYPSDEMRNALQDFRQTPHEHIKLSEESGLPLEWRLSALICYWMSRVNAFMMELEGEAKKGIAERLLDYIREESLVMNQLGSMSLGLIRKRSGSIQGGRVKKRKATERHLSIAEKVKQTSKKTNEGYEIKSTVFRGYVEKELAVEGDESTASPNTIRNYKEAVDNILKRPVIFVDRKVKKK